LWLQLFSPLLADFCISRFECCRRLGEYGTLKCANLVRRSPDTVLHHFSSKCCWSKSTQKQLKT